MYRFIIILIPILTLACTKSDTTVEKDERTRNPNSPKIQSPQGDSKYSPQPTEAESTNPTNVEKLDHVTLAFKEAIKAGELDAVKSAVDNGADINAPLANGSDSIPPLLAAISLGHKEIALWLVNQNANLNVRYAKYDVEDFSDHIFGHGNAVSSLIRNGKNKTQWPQPALKAFYVAAFAVLTFPLES